MTSPGETEAATDDTAQSFLAHLEDLRRTILLSAGTLVVTMGLVIPFVPRILDLLATRLDAAGVDPAKALQVIGVASGFALTMRLVFWSGLILALPVILFFVANFVFPGLTRGERKVVLRALSFAAVLFAAGVAMGYFMTVPVALRFMFRIEAWLGVRREFIEIGDYVSFILKLLLAFGLAFELPVVVLALGSLGIVDSSQLRSKRRHVLVGLLVMAMFLTPQDPLTMLLMAVPLAVLYEVCIWMIRAEERHRAAKNGQPVNGEDDHGENNV